MLFTANVYLYAPYLVVSRTNTLQNVTSNTRYVFGLIQKVYTGCVTLAEDQTVFYDGINARPINYGNKEYWVIKESDIIWYEVVSIS